ncbi:NAD(P)-binding protein [Mycena polygramma]|nr:NAD(P)-binding protein [Mycena polygramma]
MPTIAIFGANGTQGSSVFEAVLADGKYTPRAVTRSLDTDASKALIARGVEVVVGDLWDEESLKKAIKGSDAVFGNTNFWAPDVYPADPQGKGEITQGKNLVDAAKEVGVKFFIWSPMYMSSSLPSSAKESNGLYKHAYHVDNKSVIEDYLKASGVPYAMLLTAWFLENLIGSLSKTDTGYIPKYKAEDTQTSTWVAHDLGASAVALLTHYPDASKGVLGKSYPVISARFKYPELTAAIDAAIKKEVTFTPVPTSGTHELDEMFLYQAKIGMYNTTPVPNPDLVTLGVKFGTLEEFVQKEVVARYA